jgi:hypothetical protein
MKYYCKKYGTVYKDKCGLCAFVECGIESVVPIPDHETVEQWEERTGEEYPDTAPVYVLLSNGGNSLWLPTDRITAPEFNSSIPFVVATEAGSPPSNWRP